MTEPQLIAVFCIGCGVVVLVGRIASAVTRNAREKGKLTESLANHIVAVDAADHEARTQEVVAMVARSVGIRREKLTPNIDLIDDLRVPPGEFDSLLDDVQERFGIKIEPKRIRTVGDIVALIELKAE